AGQRLAGVEPCEAAAVLCLLARGNLLQGGAGPVGLLHPGAVLAQPADREQLLDLRLAVGWLLLRQLDPPGGIHRNVAGREVVLGGDERHEVMGGAAVSAGKEKQEFSHANKRKRCHVLLLFPGEKGGRVSLRISWGREPPAGAGGRQPAGTIDRRA